MSGLAVRAEHFVTAPGSLLTVITGTRFILGDTGERYRHFDVGETWL